MYTCIDTLIPCQVRRTRLLVAGDESDHGVSFVKGGESTSTSYGGFPPANFCMYIYVHGWIF